MRSPQLKAQRPRSRPARCFRASSARSLARYPERSWSFRATRSASTPTATSCDSSRMGRPPGRSWAVGCRPGALRHNVRNHVGQALRVRQQPVTGAGSPLLRDRRRSGRLEVSGDLHDLVIGPAEARSLINGTWAPLPATPASPGKEASRPRRADPRALRCRKRTPRPRPLRRPGPQAALLPTPAPAPTQYRRRRQPLASPSHATQQPARRRWPSAGRLHRQIPTAGSRLVQARAGQRAKCRTPPRPPRDPPHNFRILTACHIDAIAPARGAAISQSAGESRTQQPANDRAHLAIWSCRCRSPCS